MEYKLLLESFIKQGYQPSFFTDSPSKMNKLILRHDIDFDVGYAHKLSLIEDELGIKSSFFFLLHSKSYNLFESENVEMIQSMIEKGHSVSIHFDPTIYEDIELGLKKEVKLFETVFGVTVKFISIHRPSKFFLNNPEHIFGIRHTYQPVYFEEIKYFADSRGGFRYGDPLESKCFSEKRTMQLLIHPVWWITKSRTPVGKLNEFLEYRVDVYKAHMANNCLPYKEYLKGS